MEFVNIFFWDIEQVFYPPATVKKSITQRGNSTKEEVRGFVTKKFPNIPMDNCDISDAVAIGMCYFNKEGNK
jgi:Holliday junction resolvasome RuvABC endonuclease subunit